MWNKNVSNNEIKTKNGYSNFCTIGHIFCITGIWASIQVYYVDIFVVVSFGYDIAAIFIFVCRSWGAPLVKKDVLLKLMIKGFLRNLDDREEFYGEYLCVKFLASHLNSIIPIFHQKDVRTGTPVSPEKNPRI